MYRGREGQWSWVLHRITGVGVLIFLVLHIADTALVLAGPEWYNKFVALYRHPVFRIGEVFLAGALIYHALNGLRIIVLDFWPQTTRYNRQMFWSQVAVFVLAFIPAAYFMIKPLLSAGA